MKNLFGGTKDPERQARIAIRRRQWSKAIAYFEGRLQANERDFALWNLLGDLHMNNGARAQAVEAWRRALEGYALEGLHENVLGIARKVLRRAPQESDVYLLVADACLGLEYHADCLAAVRNYLNLTKQRSEADLRAFFKKLLETSLRHVHLLEELKAIFRDSEIEDPELASRVAVYIDQHAATAHVPMPAAAEGERAAAGDWAGSHNGAAAVRTGLSVDGMPDLGGDLSGDISNGFQQFEVPSASEQAEFGDHTETPPDDSDLTDGEGKDHFDLGMVYKDMKLWDAAVAELRAGAPRSLDPRTRDAGPRRMPAGKRRPGGRPRASRARAPARLQHGAGTDEC